MEYIEPIFDKEEQPQNDNITSYNNQIGYMTIDHKILYLIFIRSTEGTINDERGEQESKNENNESRIEETILEVLVYLVYYYLNHLLYIYIDHMIIMDYLIAMETISVLKKTHMIMS